jgi:hypothetical protein
MTKRDQHLLKHGYGQFARQRIARQRGDPDAGDQADHRLHQQLDATRHALVVAPQQLQVVVDEAQRAVTEGDEQHRPDVTIVQIRPQQGGDAEREQDQHAAHGRRALLVDQVPLRPIRANRLPVALQRAQPADHARAQQETDEQRGQARGARAERDVAEQIEQNEMFR